MSLSEIDDTLSVDKRPLLANMTSQASVGLLNETSEFSPTSSYFIQDDPKYLITTTVIWTTLAVVGICANLFVILVTFCSSSKKSATQYFITNLAVSDSLFLLISPTLALFNLHHLISLNELPFILGKIICKADYFLTHLTVFITCLTLMSMTFDRYIAIMHPLRALSFRSTTKAISINLTIWIASIILCIPHGYFRVLIKDYDNKSYCLNSESLYELAIDTEYIKINFNQLNLLYTITISYLIPFVAILVCFLIMTNRLTKEKPQFTSGNGSNRSSKNELHQKHRILLMIALVTFLFGVCWLPIHGFHFALRFFSASFPYESNTLFIFKTVAHTLTYLNSMLNPFLCAIMGTNFRQQIFSNRVKSNRVKTSYINRNSTINEKYRGLSLSEARTLYKQPIVKSKSAMDQLPHTSKSLTSTDSSFLKKYSSKTFKNSLDQEERLNII